MNVERLRKLEAFLRKLRPEQFNFGLFVAKQDEQGCGTVCCAVGWLPKIEPKLWFWEGYVGVFYKDETGLEQGPIEGAATYFDISHDESLRLFDPYVRGGSPLSDKATPTQVADYINTFILSKEPQP